MERNGRRDGKKGEVLPSFDNGIRKSAGRRRQNAWKLKRKKVEAGIVRFEKYRKGTFVFSTLTFRFPNGCPSTGVITNLIMIIES